jgi:hypothetical protein
MHTLQVQVLAILPFQNDVLGTEPLSRDGNGHVLTCIYRIGAPATMHMHQGVFATEEIREW